MEILRNRHLLGNTRRQIFSQHLLKSPTHKIVNKLIENFVWLELTFPSNSIVNGLRGEMKIRPSLKTYFGVKFIIQIVNLVFLILNNHALYVINKLPEKNHFSSIFSDIV